MFIFINTSLFSLSSKVKEERKLLKKINQNTSTWASALNQSFGKGYFPSLTIDLISSP